MPVLQSNQLTPEEERHEVISDAILSDAPEIPGFQCVRGLSPLVIIALQRANNPFITARRGFEEAGIEFDEEGNQTTTAAEFAMVMMPKTAEVLVLMTCTKQELKHFSRNPEALEDAALDLVDASSIEDLAGAMNAISDQQHAMAKTRADQSPEDEKPSAAAIEEGGATGSKKLARTGSRKS